MGANERRELTYYVKLKDDVNLRNQQITNTATLYSNGSQGVYDRGSGEANFTPTINYDGKFTKDVNGNIIRNNDGSYTIPFKLSIALNEDTSNYTIKNLQFRDFLRNIDNDLLQYVTFDHTSFKLYKNDKMVDPTKYNVKWSSETNNTDFKEWNEVTNPKSFKLSGNEGSPIDLSPGQSCYVTYNVIVKPEAFAKMHSDSITVDNRFVAHADNVDQNRDGGFEAYNSIPIIKTYEWNGKHVDQNATTEESSEIINDDKYTYNGDKIEKDSTSENSFIVPKGSYKYTVKTNKTLNDFDVTDVIMTDTLTSKYMKYVGYVKVEALEANTISSDLNKVTSDTYTSQPTYETVGTKWVKIDGKKTFSLKPSDLGWTKQNYAYRFTYYAKPEELGAFTETKVKNKFTLNGIVKKGNGEFTFNENDVSKETTLTIKGTLNMTAKKVSWYYSEPTKESGTWSKGELYWVVDVGGTQIAQGTTFRDLIKSDDKITSSYLHDDSLVDIYKGTLPDGKSISDYKDLNDLTSTGGLTSSIKDKFKTDFKGTAPNYNELLFTANEDIKLENGEKVYMIIKSEPAELPSPTNNRDTKTYKNSISIKVDDNYVSEQPAEKTLYTAPNILKELGQVFKYDGKTVTNLQIGADKTESGAADTSKICTDLLKESRGVFVSWAFKVNYDGKLNGEYSALEDIPEGMELSYIRVKWHGEDASSVRSKEISGIDSTVWTRIENKSTNDNKSLEQTIYYVNKNNKQAMIQLGDFEAKEERDNNSVDVQVVCRVTDSSVLLGAKSHTFTNKVTLKKDGKDIDTATSPETVQLTEENKNINKKQGQSNGQKIDFEINANQLGQTLPTNDGDNLKLVDELGENLQLDTTSIKVFKNDTEQITNCATSYTNNTLEITVPNNVPIKITYTVTVNAKPEESVKVTNTAYWKGYSKDSGKIVESDYSYKVGGGIEALSKVNFKLTKQDQNNLNTVLQGATFDIEKCELNGNVITTSKIATVTTDANGVITQDLDFDTLYKITETKAPDGYVLDNKPIYILDLKDKEKDTSYLEKVKTLVKENKLYVIYKQQNFDIQVQNHKGEITVVKKFINDAAGNSHNPVSGTYKFGLYTDENNLTTPLQTVSITYNASETQEKSVKFINLDLSKTYYVFEIGDDNKPIVDTSKEVTINKLQYTVDYKTEGKSTNETKYGQTVTVTNRSRTKILPSTGSYGTLIYRISGAMLVLASLIVLINIHKKNHLNDKSKKGERNEAN